MAGDSERDSGSNDSSIATRPVLELRTTSDLVAAKAGTDPSRVVKVGEILGQLGARDLRSKGLADLGSVQFKTVGDVFGAISSDLVQGWRSSLMAGQESIRLSVADSMTREISERNLTAFATIGAKAMLPDLTSANLSRSLTELTSSYLGRIGESVRESLMASIRPAALAATSALMEQINSSNEAEREYEDALWHLGWWVPPSVTSDFFWQVGRLARDRRRHELRREMVEASRSRDFRRVVEGWMELEPFRARRRFIRDGLRDHLDGRYRVSIPTLLPHIEGIAIEAFAPGSDATSPKAAIETAAQTYDAVMGPAMVDTVTILWARQDFGPIANGSRRLNRHLILHGRSTGYASAENSAKVLFALDLLASVVEEARRRRDGRSKAS